MYTINIIIFSLIFIIIVQSITSHASFFVLFIVIRKKTRVNQICFHVWFSVEGDVFSFSFAIAEK